MEEELWRRRLDVGPFGCGDLLSHTLLLHPSIARCIKKSPRSRKVVCKGSSVRTGAGRTTRPRFAGATATTTCTRVDHLNPSAGSGLEATGTLRCGAGRVKCPVSGSADVPSVRAKRPGFAVYISSPYSRAIALMLSSCKSTERPCSQNGSPSNAIVWSET